MLPIQRWNADAGKSSRWKSERWKLRRGNLFLTPGDSPLGLAAADRLVAAYSGRRIIPYIVEQDPMEPREALPVYDAERAAPAAQAAPHQEVQEQQLKSGGVRTAMSIEIRDGVLCAFMPPVEKLEDYLELVAAVEATAEEMQHAGAYRGLSAAVRSARRGHQGDARSRRDRGQHPAGDELARGRRYHLRSLRGRARRSRLGANSFLVDGRHTGTGGGNHVVVGGGTPADSPFLRRPDLLKSLVLYWQRHPSLSYLFSGHVHRPDQPGAAHRRGAP